ncbi:hypothetical protein QVD17_07975 [Tagetes erecta]|uniref:BED-type domain-containing protein n=1 Tax=Tagetes erecta TaxID=13708 RepID=A0AAD8L5A0_TARER|nr:hypothetical protein QVD17_07975 [Tagetes erecta]
MSGNTEFEDEVESFNSSKDYSKVWLYFDKIEEDGIKKGRCNGCGKVLKANKGTTGMQRHIDRCFDTSEPGPPKKRAPLDQALYREKLAYSIIKHNYPFSYVEHEWTRELHKFLHRDVKYITRNTAKADVLKIYDREKTNLKEKLQKVTGRICLTADLWNEERKKKLEAIFKGMHKLYDKEYGILSMTSSSTLGSSRGRVLSKYRTSLLSSTVEALLCARDWLFGLEDEDDNEIEEGLAEDIESLYPTHASSHH